MTKKKIRPAIVTDLISWLKKPGNSCAKLASVLGYKDSAAIRQWVNRGSIPSYQVDRVKTVLQEK